MKTFIKTQIVITIIICLSACKTLASQPGITSDADSEAVEPTPQAQAAEKESADEGYDGETDLIDPACQMESILVEVEYDHRWTWSPDGTENTGYYTGTANDTINFLLFNDGYGNFDSDTNTIFYSQEGIIQGDPGKCDIKGKGMAEIMLYGTCRAGVIELEWIESDTGESEATMTCDGKEYLSLTYYPLQMVLGFPLDDDGMGYKSSESTALPLFRDVSMEWMIHYVPSGKKQ
jgi:hypothetical protein